jgi:hypothetical protein
VARLDLEQPFARLEIMPFEFALLTDNLQHLCCMDDADVKLLLGLLQLMPCWIPCWMILSGADTLLDTLLDDLV